MTRSAPLVSALLLSAVGCGPYGVSLGSEEPCLPDARLTSPDLLRGPELVTSCARIGDNQLVNSGFELPLVGSCQNGLFCQFPAADVPGWQTNDVSQVIEIWNDGHRDVSADEGRQFVELNADSRGTVWQDLSLDPGQLLYWSLSHRGRTGPESFELLIGPPEAQVSQGGFTSAADDWSRYAGLYRVGGTETTTRFSLVSNTPDRQGNLLDSIVFAPVDER